MFLEQSSYNFQSSATSIGSDTLLDARFGTCGLESVHYATWRFITRYKILYFIVVDRLQRNSWTFHVTYYCLNWKLESPRASWSSLSESLWGLVHNSTFFY